MATLKERFLASIDRLIGSDCECFGNEHTRDFYISHGTKMAIICPDGNIRAMGGSRWVQHCYGDNGQLLSRTPMRKTVKEGECIVYGHTKVDEAYRNQPRWVPESLQSGLTIES